MNDCNRRGHRCKKKIPKTGLKTPRNQVKIPFRLHTTSFMHHSQRHASSIIHAHSRSSIKCMHPPLCIRTGREKAQNLLPTTHRPTRRRCEAKMTTTRVRAHSHHHTKRNRFPTSSEKLLHPHRITATTQRQRRQRHRCNPCNQQQQQHQ